MIAQLIPVDGSPVVTLYRDITVVGRDGDICDLAITHKSVSKLHSVLVKSDGLLFVRDLGSTNGTKVNGQKIMRGALLPGDMIAFAGAKFKIFLGPGESEPPQGTLTESIPVTLPSKRPSGKSSKKSSSKIADSLGKSTPPPLPTVRDISPPPLPQIPEPVEKLPLTQQSSSDVQLLPQEETSSPVEVPVVPESKSDVRLLTPAELEELERNQ